MLLRHDRPLTAVACPAGIPYVLDERGQLYRVLATGTDLRGTDVVSLQTGGAHLLVKTAPRNARGARVPAQIHLFEADRHHMSLEIPAHLPQRYLIDSNTGELHSLDGSLAFRRYNSRFKAWIVAARFAGMGPAESLEVAESRGRGARGPLPVDILR